MDLCDRTTSEMRGLSSRIQIERFSMKRECSKHTYEAYKIRISLKKVITHWFKVYKIEKKVLQKIEHICGSI
jgi:hypothetical protein